MRTLLVCRGPIAFETLEVYRRCGWRLPHVVVSAKEWIADLHRTAPWIADVPANHVHYLQEYTDVDAILHIARAQRIDAIYPGYGFLAENAEFATRVQQAGMRFIGPEPETLRAVGDKDAAIALGKQLGIPTIPGDDALIAFAQTHRQEETAAATVRRTLALARGYPGYPIRLKHPAGGGGKGQRVLAVGDLQAPDAAAKILDALAKLWAEMGVSPAAADAHKGILLELNLPRPLHWEVQLFGDGHSVVHFAARDCSLQNHGYQKFIELALHPQAIAAEIEGLDPYTQAARIASLRQRQTTLQRICADALRLGQAVRLRGAATVEFLIDEQGAPYFLEVNPRIQVEHGVTEGVARVRGQPIRLVEWQQRVAAGERLDFCQSDITFSGDAIEVRVNAWHEDLSPVLGGVVHAVRFDPSPELQEGVRIDASGLLQRHTSWVVPSYDANFALVIVSGPHRHATLDRLIATLDTALHVHGSTELHTNVQPVLGMLTLMRALPPETAFRTDTSLLWMVLVALLVGQKQAVLSLLPSFPRRLARYDTARFARLLHDTLQAGFAHPSRLLTYYLKRLTQHDARPLAPLEVLWQLAEELRVPLYDEERQQGAALQQAMEALWGVLSGSAARLRAFSRTVPGQAQDHIEYGTIHAWIGANAPGMSGEDAAELLHELLGWLQTTVPALTALIKILESTHIHTLLTVNDDLSVTRPAFLEDEAVVMQLQHLLSRSLRPTMLRHGELLSPMEATIYHQPEPGAPPFVEIGEEVKVGQTLALLEAMKMFTELPSPVEGVVVAILVDSGQGVKTGTPLFRIASQDTAMATASEATPQMTEATFTNRFGLLLPEIEAAAVEVPGHTFEH
jgi:acetyl/propionyl-CoA carboxylase alpha subunit